MTLKSLNSYFYKDEHTIYYKNYGMKKPHPIPNVDAESFNLETPYLASDKNCVYAICNSRPGLQIFTDLDRESLVFIPREVTTNLGYFTDNYALYNYNRYFIEYVNIHARDKIKTWLKENYPERNAWWNWDDSFYASLKKIDKQYFTDGTQVFYYFKKGENKNLNYPYERGEEFGSDTASFLILKHTNLEQLQLLNDSYSKDNDRVFYCSLSIPADTKTFSIIDNHFAKDKQGIWYKGHLSIIDDVKSFKIIPHLCNSKTQYVIDHGAVYAILLKKLALYRGSAYSPVKLKNSDPKSFQHLNEVWAKDTNNVYNEGVLFKNANTKTFKIIENTPFALRNWAKDDKFVFNAYRKNIKKGLDGASFKILNAHWAKDNFVVFNIRLELIQRGADAKTFRVLDDENGNAEDVNYFYEFQEFEFGDILKVVKTKKKKN